MCTLNYAIEICNVKKKCSSYPKIPYILFIYRMFQKGCCKIRMMILTQDEKYLLWNLGSHFVLCNVKTRVADADPSCWKHSKRTFYGCTQHCSYKRLKIPLRSISTMTDYLIGLFHY